MSRIRGGIPPEEVNVCIHDEVKWGLNFSPNQRAIYTKIVLEHSEDTSLADMLGTLAERYRKENIFFAEPDEDERLISCTVDEKLGRVVVTNIISTPLPAGAFYTAQYALAVRGNEVLASLDEV